jgi:phenylacetate-CoA ligase
MQFDLTHRWLRPNAYSDNPFTFLDQDAQRDLGNIASINLIENGDRTARENWQNKQLTNLLRHAHARSKFWRGRMPSRLINHDVFHYLPILTREDVAIQVSQEGALATNGGDSPSESYTSTGSTGTPVNIFVTPQIGYYNSIRSLAQYFINGLSLDENKVQILPLISLSKLEDRSSAASITKAWAGPLGGVYRNGSNKRIKYLHNNDLLISELEKDPVGYLVCPSRYVEILTDNYGIERFAKLGIKLWIHTSDHRDSEIVNSLANAGIRSLSIYSAGEIGPIAYECSKFQGYYHVAHTNVIVERDDDLTASFNGMPVGRLLVTHLHSYATPIIRYDVGDFGALEATCRCGHNGATLSNIFGRGKHFLRHPNGNLLPFYLSTRALLEAVHFQEARVRQEDIDTIKIEIGGRETITPQEELKIKNLLIAVTDPAFKIVIIPVRKIDWLGNPKRLFFASSVP